MLVVGVVLVPRRLLLVLPVAVNLLLTIATCFLMLSEGQSFLELEGGGLLLVGVVMLLVSVCLVRMVSVDPLLAHCSHSLSFS